MDWHLLGEVAVRGGILLAPILIGVYVVIDEYNRSTWGRR